MLRGVIKGTLEIAVGVCFELWTEPRVGGIFVGTPGGEVLRRIFLPMPGANGRITLLCLVRAFGRRPGDPKPGAGLGKPRRPGPLSPRGQGGSGDGTEKAGQLTKKS